MKTASKVVIALVTALSLVAAGVSAQSSRDGSTSGGTPEEKPAGRGVVMPEKGSEGATTESVTAEPKPIEAPAPGVPVDERTYRELKERAKEGQDTGRSSKTAQ